MTMHHRFASGLQLLRKGILGADPSKFCGSRLLQQRLASYRSGSGGRDRAARASWSLERTTEKGGAGIGRERWGGDSGSRGGGSYSDRSQSQLGGRRERDSSRAAKDRWGAGGRDGGSNGRSRGRDSYGQRSENAAAAPTRWGSGAKAGEGRGEFVYGWEEEEEGRPEGEEGEGKEHSQRSGRSRAGAGSSYGSRGSYARSGGGGGRGGGRWGGGGGGGREEWRQRERDRDRGSWEDSQQQPKAPSLREQWVGDYVYGVSPVLAALKAGRRQVHALYIQEGIQLSKRKDKAAVQAVRALATEAGAKVVEASKHDLNLVTDNRPHQGLVLDCSALEFETLGSFPDAPFSGRDESGAVPLWLCLDEVMDPQNFGAALRSAYFLGVSGVLTCHRNSAPLSAVVSKASAGAMELMAVHSMKSMPQALAEARRRGWQVLGAAAEEGAMGTAAFSLDRPTLLVVGNEGYGVRPVVKRLCDATLRIDGRCAAGAAGTAAGLVDSLNVSVATGILLHQLIHSSPQAGRGGES